jgi:hypothetical protein
MLQIYYVTGRAITGWYINSTSSGINQTQLTFKGSSYATNQSDWNAVGPYSCIVT